MSPFCLFWVNSFEKKKKKTLGVKAIRASAWLEKPAEEANAMPRFSASITASTFSSSVHGLVSTLKFFLLWVNMKKKCDVLGRFWNSNCFFVDVGLCEKKNPRDLFFLRSKAVAHNFLFLFFFLILLLLPASNLLWTSLLHFFLKKGIFFYVRCTFVFFFFDGEKKNQSSDFFFSIFADLNLN